MNPSSPPLIMVVSIVAASSILVDTHHSLRVGRSFLRSVVQGGDLRAEYIYQTKVSVSVFYLNIAAAFNMNTNHLNDGNESIYILSIYIYKVLISVCLFVCQIITSELRDRFSSNFEWGTREN